MTNFFSKRAFTLVELLASVAIVAVISISFFGLFDAILKFIQVKRIHTQAAALATEQMELIRNLRYSDVGTVGGIPSGAIAPEQSITRGNIAFIVKTYIRYVNDPFDDPQEGKDPLSTDYKQAKITISWDTVWGDGSMFFLTNIAPKGVESAAGGGTLKINVFDANGLPVPQADVDIVASGAGVNLINLKTNNNGLIILPGAPEAVENYHITVDKPGYSQDRTYSLDDPPGNVLPTPMRLSVFEGQTTEVSFAIDLTGSLIVNTLLDKNPNPNEPLSLSFAMRGNKLIGQDASGDPFYKYINASTTTDISGAVSFDVLEWDSYRIDFSESALGYNLIQYDPPANPVTVLPNTVNTISFLFKEPYSAYSLLVSLIDENNNPLLDANINLVQSEIFYNQTLSTGITGQAFFDDLTAADYDITITKDGYNSIEIENITINGNEEQKFQMFPII